MMLKLGFKFKSKLVGLRVKIFLLVTYPPSLEPGWALMIFFLQNKMSQLQNISYPKSLTFRSTRLYIPNSILCYPPTGIMGLSIIQITQAQSSSIIPLFVHLFSFSRRQCQTGDVRFAMTRDVAFGRKSHCWELDTRSGRRSFLYLQCSPNDYAWGNHSFLLILG